jgi:hypothetical protein
MSIDRELLRQAGLSSNHDEADETVGYKRRLDRRSQKIAFEERFTPRQCDAFPSVAEHGINKLESEPFLGFRSEARLSG